MAHIPDGLLSLPVLAGGAAVTAATVAVAVRRLDERDIPRTAILAAAFFTTSLIAIPLGPSSIHVLLSTLMGFVLGILAVPAVLVGLFLQSLLFGFGGLTTLGVNTFNIAIPGVLTAALFGPMIAKTEPVRASILAGVAAAFTVLLTAAGVSAALALSSSDYVPSAGIIAATYIPLGLIEAMITGFAVLFLKRVKPDALVATGAA